MPNSTDFIASATVNSSNGRSRPLTPAIRKRSVSLGGHRTSVSLEQAFWDELSRIARQRGQSTNALVAEIDRARGGEETSDAANLSSAVRLFVLGELQRAAGLATPDAPMTASQ